jgi:uncharacterized protein (DUF1697 family)
LRAVTGAPTEIHTAMPRRSESASRTAAPAARLIAFLRAINVGGHIVKMDALRAHFASLKLADVETVIASGNVIFGAPAADAAALEQRIEQHLRTALGYDVATFLRTPAEVAAAAEHDAFPGAGAGGSDYPLYVAFTRAPPSAEAVRTLLTFRNEIDDFHVHGREIYWAARKGMGQSKFTGARLEKIIGMPATARNVTTVRKLAAMTSGI